MTSPQNPLVGAKVLCPLGCGHPHIVIAGREIVPNEKDVPEYRFNGERVSICDLLFKKKGTMRLLWSMNSYLTAKDADTLYQLWRTEIFRQAENYGN